MYKSNFLDPEFMGNGVGEDYTPPVFIPWTPVNDPAIISWHDPTDSGTITLDGGFVTEIADKSGNNHNLTQPTPSLRPVVEASFLGPDVIYYDSSDGMSVPSISVPTSGNYSVVIFARIQFVFDIRNSIIALGGPNGFGFDAGNASQFDGRILSDVSSNVLLTGGPYELGQYKMFEVVFDFDSTEVRTYIDGSANSSVTDYAVKLGSTQDLLIAIDKTLNVGIGMWQGDTITTEDITPATRQKIEGYLAHKWGTQSSLPDGHPFKIEPPYSNKSYIIEEEFGIVTVDGLPITS